MKKIGLIFDSSSGYTKEEADKLGIGLIPLMINVKNKDYMGNIEIKLEDLYNIWNEDKKIMVKTSSPRPKDIINVFDDMLKKYDELIVVSISKKLSTTNNVIKKIAKSNEEYIKKIHVFDSIISTPFHSAMTEDILNYFKESDDIETLFKAIEEFQKNLKGWVIPGHISHLYRGGRITKVQYALGSLLRIKVILTIQDGIIDPKETHKVKNDKNLINKSVSILNELYNSLTAKFNDLNYTDFFKIIIKSNNSKIFDLENKIIENIELKETKLDVVNIGTEQASHLGPDSMGFTLGVKLKYFIDKIKKAG